MSNIYKFVLGSDGEYTKVPVVITQDDIMTYSTHPSGFDKPKEQKMEAIQKRIAAIVGFNDTLDLPEANRTMTAAFSELRESLAHAMSFNFPANMAVELEVPKNMTQADIDTLCGANAHRIIVKRTHHELV